MKQKLFVRIDGIYCEHCVETITRALGAAPGIERVSIRNNVAEITGESLPSSAEIVETIRCVGYETDETKISEDRRKAARIVRERTVRWYEFLLIAALLLLLALALRLIFGYNVFNAIPAVDSSLSRGMLFVTGVLTSVHCISMCGAIGIFASYESGSPRSIGRPLLYNTGRVISYTALGGLAGAVGSAFSVSMTLRGVILLAAALVMLLMSLSMLGVVSFRLPRFFTIRAKGGRRGAFVIGLFNGLMPCGPLQAMQIYALSTGSFAEGALSMALFALGTVPLMLTAGAALNLAKGKAKILFGKIAAVLMVILSLSMLVRGLSSLGVDAAGFLPARYDGIAAAMTEDGVQTAAFDLEFDSYADIVVQKGVPVRIVVHADAGKITGCNNEIVSRDFGFDVKIVPGDNIIEFLPEEEGDYVYSCWMNMIRNRIRVIDDPGYFK